MDNLAQDNKPNIKEDATSSKSEERDNKPKSKKPKKTKQPFNKGWLVCLTVGIICLAGGIASFVCGFLLSPGKENEREYADIFGSSDSEPVYSDLTGLELTDASLKTAPAYCIQTPNGTDGARPQSGLNEAGVVFEAIAEAGITRFAAIYQNPTSAVIGPIRSLRIYYLEWDTPFDCTIVHAGGSGDALAAVSHGYKDLSEDYTYMYRGTYGSRLWNNLFTTATDLKHYSENMGYSTSNIKGFSRMTPEESAKDRVNRSVSEKLVITKPTQGDTSATIPGTSSIGLRFGGFGNFNVDYTYNPETNTYLRSYQSGNPHEVYACSTEDLGRKNPEDVCTLSQLNPAVVVAMVVNEGRASDNYHEDITTLGSGDAYIFQNGTAIRGTWKKASREEQITFTDESGSEIKLAPGQTFVSAIPTYGSVEF